MSWETLLKRWAYGADNISEYLQSIRRQIDFVLDSDRGFNQKIKEMKKEVETMTKEQFDRMKNSLKESSRYRIAKEHFEEGSSMYEYLVNEFGHYAARRAKIPNEIIKKMVKPAWVFDARSVINVEFVRKAGLCLWRLGDGSQKE